MYEVVVEKESNLEECIQEINNLYTSATHLKKEHLLKMFKIGGVVSRLKVPYGQKEEALSIIRARTGVHENQLREWRRIFAMFEGKESSFRSWLDMTKDPTEQMLRDMIKSDRNPEVLGDEALVRRIVRRIERLAEDLETLSTVSESRKEEIEGVVLKAKQELENFKEIDWQQKNNIPRNEAYLDLVRNLPCCITGEDPPSDPHHVDQGGVGIKGSDYSVIPLSRDLHQKVEEKGHAWLEETFGVRISDLIVKTFHAALFGYRIKLPET